MMIDVDKLLAGTAQEVSRLRVPAAGCGFMAEGTGTKLYWLAHSADSSRFRPLPLGLMCCSAW
jgi:hypothetical protein